ncbi:hypothetical protein THRCLA_08485 [Thraustotheca clavata]|uniref:EGF-like domain-containing protein n=1 Tax=Thraustotheca clavata TaxID=74557 RepID=A0A1V9Z603_9STRA|nr:hypothetical protein THRCLA_08485 [Thraustotheca clavata]
MATAMHPWPLRHRFLQESTTLIGDTCRNTSDCPSGSVCVAGSAFTSIQSCVQTPGCGGNVAGNCPGVLSAGQLVCAWNPVSPSKCSDYENSCASFDGKSGIYMCMSIDRCDSIHGNSSCSSGCQVSNGLSCNGRGGCQTTDGKTYKCSCNEGWDGDFCDNVVSSKCQEGIGNCGQFGKCINGLCSCLQGYKGDQCQIPPANSTNTTTIPLSTPINTSDGKSNGNGNTINPNESSSSNSWWWIIVVAIAGVACLAFVAFVVRKKMKEREDERANAAARELMEENLDDGVQTPKGMIQTL